jgi:hypothetical protein
LPRLICGSFASKLNCQKSHCDDGNVVLSSHPSRQTPIQFIEMEEQGLPSQAAMKNQQLEEYSDERLQACSAR